MAIKVHHLERSRSHRVLWLLEELGVDYTLETYARDPKTMLGPPELKKVHPLGKSPLLEHDGRVFAESANILEHLVEAHGGRFRPAPSTPEHERYRFFMHYAEGSLMPLMLLQLVLGRIEGAPVPFFLKPVTKSIAGKARSAFAQPQSELHLGYVNAELAKSTWLCGEELSAADIQMSFPLEAALSRVEGASVPHVRAFIERCRARPAYQTALEKGGPVL